ncbi:MAG: N-acetyltransferase [Candidatus Omnitrophica bacterium]|nr:N-acetyltransferase [Candidatus Omnitrophota bacterium]
MKKWPQINIQIGDGCRIDEDVILGYPSGRLKQRGSVILGAGANIRSGSIVYEDVVIGDRFETGHHVVIREQNKIGNEVAIWTNTVIDYGCVIGNNVKIHTNGYVAQFTVIEDDVFIAPGAVFANDKYPLSPHLEGPLVKRGARLGVNVTILPGIVSGERALVGAGSVVTKNVPQDAVVAGNPARVIGRAEDVKAKLEAKGKILT